MEMAVNVLNASKQNCLWNLVFSEVSGGPEGYEKVREAERNSFHLFSSKTDLIVPS